MVFIGPSGIQNGQSVVQADQASALGIPPSTVQTTIGDLSASTPPAPMLDATSAKIALRYPLEVPRHYMTFVIGDYTRSSWKEVGALNETARFTLPLPNSMVDNHNIRYDIEPIGAVGALTAATLGGAINAYKNNDVSGAISAAGSSVASNFDSQKIRDSALGIAARTTGMLGRGIAAYAGYTVNEFMTVMVKGPSYKVRQFNWRFSPKNSDESEALRQIIELTNNSMALSLTGVGSMFFRWPSIWQVSFSSIDSSQDLGAQTFRMKKSILYNATFNYTPSGMPSIFNRTAAPECLDITFEFIELEYWLKGDFGLLNGPTTNIVEQTPVDL
jgi:hypothetical protein